MKGILSLCCLKNIKKKLFTTLRNIENFGKISKKKQSRSIINNSTTEAVQKVVVEDPTLLTTHNLFNNFIEFYYSSSLEYLSEDFQQGHKKFICEWKKIFIEVFDILLMWQSFGFFINYGNWFSFSQSQLVNFKVATFEIRNYFENKRLKVENL